MFETGMPRRAMAHLGWSQPVTHEYSPGIVMRMQNDKLEFEEKYA